MLYFEQIQLIFWSTKECQEKHKFFIHFAEKLQIGIEDGSKKINVNKNIYEKSLFSTCNHKLMIFHKSCLHTIYGVGSEYQQNPAIIYIFRFFLLYLLIWFFLFWYFCYTFLLLEGYTEYTIYFIPKYISLLDIFPCNFVIYKANWRKIIF